MVNRLRLVGVLCFAACLFTNSSWATPAPTTCPDLTLREIASGVWIHTSWNAIAGDECIPSNGMVLMGEDRVLLIDTPWTPAQTEELLSLLKPMISKSDLLSPRKIVNLFITHGHSDRAGGLSIAAARGIPSYAFLRTEIEAARHNVGKISFALLDDRFAFDLGDRVVEVIYPGPGHTIDNAIVYDRSTKTLFGGCLIRARSATDLGNTRDAYIAEWRASVARIATRYPEVRAVVPGHGEGGGAELFVHTFELLKSRPALP
jgi:metallo-beta-lactamase class B